MKICLCTLLLTVYLSFYANAQSPWTSASFKFSKDVIPLADMSGATPITFTGTSPQPLTSGLLNFPSGFTFHYGLKIHSGFAVCRNGFLRLGSDIASNIPDAQDDVIVPLYNGTGWPLCRSLLTGTGPNRKFIIEWEGIMQPSGRITKYQVWLYERTGKIEIVYQFVEGFYGFSSNQDYKIFCKVNILQQSTLASLKVVPNNAQPLVNYSSILTSHDSIYANTRYRFEPDTIKPAVPAAITFSNVLPGCLTTEIHDNSTNETFFQLDRSDDNVNFSGEKKFYSASSSTTGLIPHNQAGLQPFWNYRYRVYASNGFVNSDTVTSTVQTPMPLLTGIRQIPGDYPSVTALLQDAACKHMGPDLIIELKSTYSFAAESSLPVAFDKKLQNRFINSIVIRPATGATINWEATTNNSIFYVDSVKYVFLDGRPGGTGTNRNFTLKQNNTLQPVVHYVNSADSGGMRYCNIISPPYANNDDIHGVAVDSRDSLSVKRKGVNFFTLSNNYFGSGGPTSSNLVHIEAEDTLSNQSFRILDNEFDKFCTNAILVEKGGIDGIISGNHFYQSVPFQTHGNFSSGSSCIKLLNTENISISGNFFGGNGPVWGQGVFEINNQSSHLFSFIHYENTAALKPLSITNNKFGNIYSRTNDITRLVYTYRGKVSINGNSVGSPDSTGSIKVAGIFWGFDNVYGKRVFKNNLISGLQCGGFACWTSYSLDSLLISGNDFGGSDDHMANTGTASAYGILGISSDSLVTIQSNKFRGMSSVNGDVTAIEKNPGIGNEKFLTLLIDSNEIHNLRAKKDVRGINLDNMRSKLSKISNNHIYSLYTTGQGSSPFSSVPLGGAFGIVAEFDEFFSLDASQGELQISGNRIHSLKPLRVDPTSVYTMRGMYVGAPSCKVWNNDIQLGIGPNGVAIDTTSTGVIAIEARAKTHLTVEHNSIFIGGRGFRAYGIDCSTLDGNFLKTFITNNIIQIDRENINSAVPHVFQKTSAATVVSAKNLWYSGTDASVSTLLQNFKNTCNCDQSSFTGNPKFANPTGDSSHYSLSLTTGSSADSAGTISLLQIATDIEGALRNNYTPVDIGSHATSPCTSNSIPQITFSASILDTMRVCSASPLNLTATISGGTFQSVQWQMNFIDIPGATTASLTVSTAGIYRLTGKTPCGVAASRSIFVLLSSGTVQPSVTISSSASPGCAGSATTFTAVPTNGGTNPIYQWQVNGINVGTNSNTYQTSTLTDGSKITCVLTSSLPCTTPTSATSNEIIMTVAPTVAPAVSITGITTVNSGQATLITAAPTNGGSGVSYQWEDSTTGHSWQKIIGNSSTTINYSPVASGDKLRCVITSSVPCASPATVTSNVISFVVNVVTAVNPVPADRYGIHLYPNPANGIVFIDTLRTADRWESLEIISADGKHKLAPVAINNRSRISFDVSTLSGGLYIALLRKRSGGAVYIRFIKF